MTDVGYSVSWSAGEPPEESSYNPITVARAWYPPEQQGVHMNSWQAGIPYTRGVEKNFNAVYACRRVLSEEVARLSAGHFLKAEDGGRVQLQSTLNRILRYPNTWQSHVNFWLGMMDRLVSDGNAYALALRDERRAVSEFIPLRSAYPYVDPEDGAIFYGVGWDTQTPGLPPPADQEPRLLIPQREVLHLRLFTPVHPLLGESPLVAAAVSANTGMAISNSTYSLFNRAARPSGYLKHPRRLSPDTKRRLADQWTQNYSGAGTGGTAVLEEGLEWVQLSMNAVDAEIVDQYRLTVEDVARIYRVPMFMLGDMSKSTFNNVEQMMRSFYSGGLGFYLKLIEEQLAQFMGLPMDQHVVFDVESGLLRAEFKDRMEGLSRGVQTGIYAPNEARRREGLPEVDHGDEPIVQAQMVTLSQAAGGEVQVPQETQEQELGEIDIKKMVRDRIGLAA